MNNFFLSNGKEILRVQNVCNEIFERDPFNFCSLHYSVKLSYKCFSETVKCLIFRTCSDWSIDHRSECRLASARSQPRRGSAGLVQRRPPPRLQRPPLAVSGPTRRLTQAGSNGFSRETGFSDLEICGSYSV